MSKKCDATNGSVPAATMTFPECVAGDPLIDVLARLNALEGFYKGAGLSDEDTDALENQYGDPLWKAVGKFKPTTFEGAVKGLRRVLANLRDDLGLEMREPEEPGLIDGSMYRHTVNVLEYFEAMYRAEGTEKLAQFIRVRGEAEVVKNA